MAQITQTFKGSHQYMGKVNGKTFVVPHGKLDIYSKNYYQSHSDDVVTSREHVKKHNPGFSDEEIDAVHSHVNNEHQKQLEESMTQDLNEAKEYRMPDGGVDHKKVDRQYKRNENQNRHMENAVLLAKHYGDENDVKMAEKHLADGEKAGHNVHYAENSKLHIGLLNKMRKARGQKEIHEANDVFAKHQINIAKKTLRMHPSAAAILGGPDHEESRKILKKHGWSDEQIKKHELSEEVEQLDESTNTKLNEEKKYDIYHKGEYHVSTTQSKTAKEAKEKYLKAYPKHNEMDVKVHLSEESQLHEVDSGDFRLHKQHSEKPLPGHSYHQSSDSELHQLHTFHSKKAIEKIRTDPQGAKRHQEYADNAKQILDHRKKTMNEHTTSIVKQLIHEAAFTRRHFRQVADIIKNHPDPKKRHEMASHHAEIFTKSNPRFDKKRFFDAAVGVMGGMNKDEARAHLSKMGWTKKQIHDHEHSLNETGQLVEHGFVGFDHKGNRHEVEASSLLAAVEHIRKKANTPKSKHHLVHAKIAEKDTPEGRKQVVHTPMDEAFELNEASLTPKEKEKKEEIVKAMKKDKAGFVKRYGKKAKEVMHATATKKAKEMKEDNTLTLVKELIHEAAFTRRHFRQVADIIKNHPDPKKRHEMASHHAEVFAKSNPRFDKKRFFDAAGVKDHMNEQVEQIDEVSKDTLKSYVTKATADVKNYSYRSGMNDALAAHERLKDHQESYEKFKSVSKLESDRVKKRVSGIMKAVKKINEASSAEIYGARLKSKKGIKKYETGDGKRHVSEKDAMAHADRVHKATGNIISVEKLDEMVLHGHPWHKKSDEELHYIAKDAKEAMEAIGTHDKHAANKYADQMNDALSILNHRYVQKITGKRKG